MKYNKNEVTGKMRDRIILQNVNRSRSLTGFASESWADTATIWAFAESKLPGSNETIIDGKNTAKNVCDFTIRYISTITEESRVVWGDKLYQVKNLKVSHDRRFISFQGVFYDSYILRGVNVDASVNGIGTTSANLKLIMSVIGQANASASTTATITKIIEVSSLVNANASLSGDINFVQKAQSSLLTSASVTGNLTIPKTFNASLLATGTTTADLTVGIAFDTDAAAFFARVTAAGGTLTTTEQNAVNTLVVQMKADGIWTKMKAIYPMVGGGQANPAAACAQNLKSSSFTGTFTSGWTFAATGVQGNGTSAFFNTLFNPNAQSTQNSSHVSVYLRTNSGGSSQGIFTCASDYGSISNNFGIGKYNGGVSMRGYIGSALSNGAAVSSNNLGLWTVSTNGSSTQILYEDGVSVSNLAYNQSLPNFNVYLGAGNYGTGGAQLYSAFNFAFSSIGDGLSATDITNFYTAVQAFQTSLNRQVN
jgi:SPP1 family predicted phage head-tail adaptor